MRQVREFICVTCPVGCAIEANVEDDALVSIKGEACNRGLAFVREELSDPRRMLTTTVRIRGADLPLVPVRSRAPLPKGLLLPVAQLLRDIELEAPTREHQVVAVDVLGTGVDIITTRALARSGT